eukprot:30154-Pelagococcus_subviridis.AAC.8
MCRRNPKSKPLRRRSSVRSFSSSAARALATAPSAPSYPGSPSRASLPIVRELKPVHDHEREDGPHDRVRVRLERDRALVRLLDVPAAPDQLRDLRGPADDERERDLRDDFAVNRVLEPEDVEDEAERVRGQLRRRERRVRQGDAAGEGAGRGGGRGRGRPRWRRRLLSSLCRRRGSRFRDLDRFRGRLHRRSVREQLDVHGAVRDAATHAAGGDSLRAPGALRAAGRVHADVHD